MGFAPGSRRWGLDVLGNWSRVDVDTDGDGDFGTGSGETLDRDDRVHNMANEISSMTPKVFDGTMWLNGVTRQPVYDANGNLRATAATGVADTVSPHVYTYDAWNRLVKVERDVDQDQVYTLGEYEHNALHWAGASACGHIVGSALGHARPGAVLLLVGVVATARGARRER